MTAYTITQGDTWADGDRRWTHFVHDDSGNFVGSYFDDRDIDDPLTDSSEVAESACAQLELPQPGWVDHDREFIFFGYCKPGTS